MASLTETEIAVLRWYAEHSSHIAGAFEDEAILEARVRLAQLNLKGQSVADGLVTERTSEAGHIVLALLDKVSNAEQDRCHLRDFCHVHGHDLARKDGATACCMAGWDLLREENERLKHDLEHARALIGDMAKAAGIDGFKAPEQYPEIIARIAKKGDK